MTTQTSLIARLTDDGFEGRAVPADASTDEQVLRLRAAYRDTFNSDLDAMAEFFIGDQHDGEPLFTEADAHESGAGSLFVLDPVGVACFDAENLDGRRVWTWIRTFRWATNTTT